MDGGVDDAVDAGEGILAEEDTAAVGADIVDHMEVGRDLTRVN